MKKIFGIVFLGLLLLLGAMACAPSPQQMVAQTPQVADDQFYAQQAYSQWQVQNSNQSFDYFLMYVWAVQSMRQGYYVNTFHVYNYAPAQTRYVYHYTPGYSSRTVTVPSTAGKSFGSSTTTKNLTPATTLGGSKYFPSASKATTMSPSPRMGSSSGNSAFTPKASLGGSRSFGSSVRVPSFHR